jgi:hypothetical protein
MKAFVDENAAQLPWLAIPAWAGELPDIDGYAFLVAPFHRPAGDAYLWFISRPVAEDAPEPWAPLQCTATCVPNVTANIRERQKLRQLAARLEGAGTAWWASVHGQSLVGRPPGTGIAGLTLAEISDAEDKVRRRARRITNLAVANELGISERTLYNARRRLAGQREVAD